MIREICIFLAVIMLMIIILPATLIVAVIGWLAFAFDRLRQWWRRKPTAPDEHEGWWR